MSSPLSSSTQYHLLTCNMEQNQIMDKHYEKQKNDYSYFSSSAPTIIDSSGLLSEANR